MELALVTRVAGDSPERVEDEALGNFSSKSKRLGRESDSPQYEVQVMGMIDARRCHA